MSDTDNANDNSGNNSSGVPLTQRKVHVQRELDRMKHVISRLQLQESRNAKRAQIAELKAKEVETVRHETEKDAKIREQLMLDERKRQDQQHERIAAVRQDRQQRAESMRRDLRQKKLEAARVTKAQHKFIQHTLSESDAEHHERCIAQHNAIKAVERSGSTARARQVDQKKLLVTENSARNKNELQTKEQELQALMEKAEALKRRVDESKSVEYAAHARLQDLCSGGKSSSITTGNNNNNINNNISSSLSNNNSPSKGGNDHRGGAASRSQNNNSQTSQSRGTTASAGGDASN